MQLTLDWDAAPVEPSAETSEWNQPVTLAGHEVGEAMVRSIMSTLERARYHEDVSRIFSDSLDVIEDALYYREDAYLEKIKKMRPEVRQAAVEIMQQLKRVYFEYAVFDVLGTVYMQIVSRWKASGMGQYFTPMDICELMVQMTLGDVPSLIAESKQMGRKLKIGEPCVGSGAMLLAAKRVIMKTAGLAGLDHFEFYGADKDPLCVKMASIQMCLTDYRWMANRMIVAAYDARDQMRKSA